MNILPALSATRLVEHQAGDRLRMTFWTAQLIQKIRGLLPHAELDIIIKFILSNNNYLTFLGGI